MSGTPRDPSDPHDPDARDSRHRGARDDASKGPARADFSKVRGSAESDSGAAPGADFSKVRGSVESTGEAAGERAHTVVGGDNLSSISKQYYGSSRHWQSLFDANRDQLDDPDLIQPGQVLRIPARHDD